MLFNFNIGTCFVMLIALLSTFVGYFGAKETEMWVDCEYIRLCDCVHLYTDTGEMP